MFGQYYRDADDYVLVYCTHDSIYIEFIDERRSKITLTKDKAWFLKIEFVDQEDLETFTDSSYWCLNGHYLGEKIRECKSCKLYTLYQTSLEPLKKSYLTSLSPSLIDKIDIYLNF